MGYPRDLDEYTEDELARELKRRSMCHERGFCDYCMRHPFTKPCRFPARHRDSRIKSGAEFTCTGVFRRMTDYALRPQDRYDSEGKVIADHVECNHCHTSAPLDREGQQHDATLTEPVG